VLVVDAVDRLAKGDAPLLHVLQEFAKDSADRGSLRIVFVSSEGHALPLLQSASAWSRALKPPYEVGDVEDEQAILFLVGEGVDRERAEEAVGSITGGRFSLMRDFVGESWSKANQTILKEMHVMLNRDLLRVGVNPTHKLFTQLVSTKSIEVDAAEQIMSKDKLDELLDKNILAVHPAGTYSFHSRAHQTYFAREKAAAEKAAAEKAAAEKAARSWFPWRF
jgi:hypothetical protein